MSAHTAQLSMNLYSFSAKPRADWSGLVDLAVAADEIGIDRLVLSDHVVFGENLDAYNEPALGGTAGGKQPTGPDGDWLEPLTTLSVIAGRTTRVRLMTGILLAALRRPAVLAKTAATLDVLSGGRLDLGVGVGWQREEYEVAGLDFAGRGRLLDHTLEVCHSLWLQQRSDYTSPELTFAGIHQMPKPTAPGGVPIWVSGTINPRTVARLSRFGAGWIPWGPDAADIGAIARMKTALLDINPEYDVDALQVTSRLPAARRADGSIDTDELVSQVGAMRSAGVTDFRVPAPATVDAAHAELPDLIEAFRAS